MQKSSIPAAVSQSLFEDQHVLRRFGWGRVSAFETEGRFAIVVQERGNLEHTLYEYDSAEEFHADVRRVVGFPSGDGGVGVPAVITPAPPDLSAGYEEPIPQSEPTVEP